MIYEIIIDHDETPNKCTITPLADRKDFKLFPVFGEGGIGPLSAPLLLHHEGECLTKVRSSFDSVDAIACVDCVWRKLPRIIRKIRWTNETEPIRVKIPEGFKTVYPRVGLPNSDPDGGLATIEAIFVASALLGHWDATLLSKYYFGRKFVEVNAQRFLELGIKQVTNLECLPGIAPKARDSYSRRLNRGRVPK